MKTASAFLLVALLGAVRLSRGWGDCYGYALVATGRAEIMIDAAMHVWDCAAIKPIIEEAGGMFTDWQGVATIHASATVATNGCLHGPALACLGSGEP